MTPLQEYKRAQRIRDGIIVAQIIVKLLILVVLVVMMFSCNDKIYTHQHNKGTKNLTEKNFAKHYKKQLRGRNHY